MDDDNDRQFDSFLRGLHLNHLVLEQIEKKFEPEEGEQALNISAEEADSVASGSQHSGKAAAPTDASASTGISSMFKQIGGKVQAHGQQEGHHADAARRKEEVQGLGRGPARDHSIPHEEPRGHI